MLSLQGVALFEEGLGDVTYLEEVALEGWGMWVCVSRIQKPDPNSLIHIPPSPPMDQEVLSATAPACCHVPHHDDNGVSL